MPSNVRNNPAFQSGQRLQDDPGRPLGTPLGGGPGSISFSGGERPLGFQPYSGFSITPETTGLGGQYPGGRPGASPGGVLDWMRKNKGILELALAGAQIGGSFLQSRAANQANSQQLAQNDAQFQQQLELDKRRLRLQEQDAARGQQGFDARAAVMMAMLPQARNFQMTPPNVGPLDIQTLRTTPIGAYIPQTTGGAVLPDGGISPAVLAQLQAILARTTPGGGAA